MCSDHTKNVPGMLFHSIHRARMAAVTEKLHERGLSDLGSPMILFILDCHGEKGEIAGQRVLAQALHVSPATIAVSLKSMERMGYVEKKVDEKDARRNRVIITEKGERALSQCFDLFREIDERMMDGFSDEERTLLDQLHRKILNNLEPQEKAKKGGCCL